LARLETMVLMSGIELPSLAIREQMVSAIQIVVHIRRFEDGVRRVEAISEITGLEGNVPQLQEIFRFVRRSAKGRGVQGDFVATGVVPRIVEELRDKAIDVPIDLFQKWDANHA